MRDLQPDREATLIEALRAIDGGATIESVLLRYPQHADALRSHVDLRARLIAVTKPDPSPQAYAAGRQALLQRLAAEPKPAVRGAALAGWLRFRPRRIALAGALVLALAGGALGASAAAGVDQAHSVLSALHVAPDSSQGGEHKNSNATGGGANQNDGISNAPGAADTGRDHANDDASNGSGNSGAAEENRPCLPQQALDNSTAVQNFSACPTQENPPAQDLATPAGRSTEDNSNNGSDHRPATPPDASEQERNESNSAPGVPTFVELPVASNREAP